MAITTFQTPLDGALFYAARGCRVFPTKGTAGVNDDDAKRPCIKGWQDEATTDATRIREFAGAFPGCNFAWALNHDDLVIDLDRKHGKDGIAAFSAMEVEHGALTSTHRVVSPTGGVHIYTKTPRRVKLSADEVARGVDIRTLGGYVLLPGSALSTGVYRIEQDPGPAHIQCPSWFLDKLEVKAPLSRPDDAEVIGSIPEGRRDNELTRWAGALRWQGLTAEELEAALHVMNSTRLTVPLPDADITRIAKSIGRKPRGEAKTVADFAEAELAEPTMTSYNAMAIKARSIPAPDHCLTEFCDTGDVIGVFGKSKAKKSWFMLQLALALGSGTDFINWRVPKARRTLLFQMEVKRDHFDIRVQRVIGDRKINASHLEVVHCRGLHLTARALAQEAIARGVEIVMIDPIYPLFQAGENAAEDIRPIVQEFSRLAERGISVFYSMHDSKGRSGDRELVDRGSGSGIIGRAYDAAFFIDPHAGDDEDAYVVRSICRNYPPSPDLATRWRGYTFLHDPDLDPTPKTSSSEARKRSRGEPLSEVAERVLRSIPATGGATKGEIMAVLPIGRVRLIECLQFLESSGRVRLVAEGRNHEIRAFISGSVYPSERFSDTPRTPTLEGLI